VHLSNLPAFRVAARLLYGPPVFEIFPDVLEIAGSASLLPSLPLRSRAVHWKAERWASSPSAAHGIEDSLEKAELVAPPREQSPQPTVRNRHTRGKGQDIPPVRC